MGVNRRGPRASWKTHTRAVVAWGRVVLLALSFALVIALPPARAATVSAASKVPPPCQSLFPSATTTRLGKTLYYNRQASVRDVVCYGFGLNPSADFPVTGDVVCGMVSAILGGRSQIAKIGVYVDGSCSAASLAGDPKSAERWLGAVCSWASDLLGVLTVKVGSILGVGCALAPSAGTSLGAHFESRHELDVATDVIRHGKCLKYSPAHFGSLWLAVDCAPSDQGFANLPLASVPITATATGAQTGCYFRQAVASAILGVSASGPHPNSDLSGDTGPACWYTGSGYDLDVWFTHDAENCNPSPLTTPLKQGCIVRSPLPNPQYDIFVDGASLYIDVFHTNATSRTYTSAMWTHLKAAAKAIGNLLAAGGGQG